MFPETNMGREAERVSESYEKLIRICKGKVGSRSFNVPFTVITIHLPGSLKSEGD
jgi:hypothetical protein